ncbi:hypothetical protein PISMIDRAFT_687411 [Pisolithus microcarpus 441]|uniref:Uncharacterized protein n=1 Tax=Pisolithus microcarpus 441 TaxID=765257 RepID=A0A0C9XSJ7_9AGAM|nr:hypothetical protein PISMIDRAFT_687411 [Pisolithus microcarpus 441]
MPFGRGSKQAICWTQWLRSHDISSGLSTPCKNHNHYFMCMNLIVRANNEYAQTVNAKEPGRWHTRHLQYSIQCESDCSGSMEMSQLQFS